MTFAQALARVEKIRLEMGDVDKAKQGVKK